MDRETCSIVYDFLKILFWPLEFSWLPFLNGRARKLRLGSFSLTFQALSRFHHFDFDLMLDRGKYESTLPKTKQIQWPTHGSGGGHELRKVSLGPSIPFPSTPYERPPLNQTYDRYERPAGIFFPLRYPMPYAYGKGCYNHGRPPWGIQGIHDTSNSWISMQIRTQTCVHAVLCLKISAF
jgi:hypothetical protein